MLLRGGLLAVAALAASYWYFIRESARADLAYGARIACSCRHIAGRSLDQCGDNFRSGMGFVSLREDEDEKSVTAWLPFFGNETARYREGPGCVLDSR
ncbi:MAG: hypothetical protein P8J20_15555 [Novosphingobium sp.]|nr:hypothetical protein [Novosphingobium sp.]